MHPKQGTLLITLKFGHMARKGACETKGFERILHWRSYQQSDIGPATASKLGAVLMQWSASWSSASNIHPSSIRHCLKVCVGNVVWPTNTARLRLCLGSGDILSLFCHVYLQLLEHLGTFRLKYTAVLHSWFLLVFHRTMTENTA